jgi:hypothetical protein
MHRFGNCARSIVVNGSARIGSFHHHAPTQASRELASPRKLGTNYLGFFAGKATAMSDPG